MPKVTSHKSHPDYQRGLTIGRASGRRDYVVGKKKTFHSERLDSLLAQNCFMHHTSQYRAGYKLGYEDFYENLPAATQAVQPEDVSGMTSQRRIKAEQNRAAQAGRQSAAYDFNKQSKAYCDLERLEELLAQSRAAQKSVEYNSAYKAAYLGYYQKRHFLQTEEGKASLRNAVQVGRLAARRDIDTQRTHFDEQRLKSLLAQGRLGDHPEEYKTFYEQGYQSYYSEYSDSVFKGHSLKQRKPKRKREPDVPLIPVMDASVECAPQEDSILQLFNTDLPKIVDWEPLGTQARQHPALSWQFKEFLLQNQGGEVLADSGEKFGKKTNKR